MDILVVDDTKAGREALRQPLLRAGHLIEAVGSGLEAVSAFGRTAPAGDKHWQMQGTSGSDLCRAIRSGGFPGLIHVFLVLPRASRSTVRRPLPPAR